MFDRQNQTNMCLTEMIIILACATSIGSEDYSGVRTRGGPPCTVLHSRPGSSMLTEQYLGWIATILSHATETGSSVATQQLEMFGCNNILKTVKSSLFDTYD